MSTNITAALIPIAVLIFCDTPKKGHIPKNWDNTTLDIKIAEIMIITYSIINYFLLFLKFYFYINYFRGKEHLKTREITKLLYVSTEPIFHHISEVIKDFMAMINQVEDKDYYTHSHGRRVQEYASKIASKMDIIGDRFERLMYAALFHDIGKIKLDDTIINGTEAPTNDEWGEIHKHPIYGREIIERSLLRSIGEIVEQHHERLDGSGYPHGIKGDSILLEARIIAVIDAFDAMTTDRSYAKAMSIQEAVKELTNDAGTKFDSEVVKYFVEVLIEEGLLSD